MGEVVRFERNTIAPAIPSLLADAVVVTRSSFGGGKGSGPMEPQVPLREYVDKADEATLARAEAKIQSLDSKIDALPGKLRWQTLGGVVATVGLIVGILAWGGDRFDGGMASTGVYAGEIVAAKQRDADQTEAIQQVSFKLDRIIQRSEAGAAVAPTK